MPPRTRKTKKDEPVTEAVEAQTSASDAIVVTEEPKKRPGRKRSELADAAREFEKWNNVVEILEGRYQKLSEKLSDVGSDISTARQHRDDAKSKLDSALNGA